MIVLPLRSRCLTSAAFFRADDPGGCGRSLVGRSVQGKADRETEMTTRLAINGYGRIGRCCLRALYESGLETAFEIVAINEPADVESMAYLTRFDSTHGGFGRSVEVAEGDLCIDGRRIRVFHARHARDVPWRMLGVDILLECSGRYSAREDLEEFLAAGCRRVLLSNPGRSREDIDATIVRGVNDSGLSADARIISAASCTTNASVPVLAVLDRRFGVEEVLLTTLHSVMNDQPQVDGYHHADLRRTRAAMQSLVPVSTGLARGVERLLPGLTGRVQARAIRVPVVNVSAIEMSVGLACNADAEAVRTCLQAACAAHPEILAYADAPHASVDFNHDAHSVIIDGSQTRVAGRMVSLLLWFDNEWAFANRMLDVAQLTVAAAA